MSRNQVLWLIVPGISLFYTLFYREGVKQSRRYLRRVIDREPKFSDVYRHFYTFAVVSIDRMYLLSGRFQHIKIVIEDQEAYEKVIKYPASVMITSHLGSFEVMRVLGKRDLASDIHILLDKAHNQRAFSLLQNLDPVMARKVIDAGKSGTELILEMQKVILNQGNIGIMGDRVTSQDRVARKEFLNGLADFPMGPWIFSLLLKVPIVVCFGLLDDKNVYRIYIEEISEELSYTRSSRQKDIDILLQAYIDRLTYYTKLQPFNWFNFYGYWHDESIKNS